MDKIALISDIHGNMPAFEATLNDIQHRNISKIFCLGDIIGKGPHSDLAVDRVQEVCQVVVQGNWDAGITKPQQGKTFVWHQQRLGADRLDYLGGLPFSYDFYMSGKRIRLYHASEESVDKRTHPWDPVERRLAMFQNTEATGEADGAEPDVVGYGDIHTAYLQHLAGKTLFNAGSVGNPLDMTQASYAVLEGTFGSRQLQPFSVQLIRVPYDIELAVQQATEEDMPELEAYSIELRTGRYRGLKKG